MQKLESCFHQTCTLTSLEAANQLWIQYCTGPRETGLTILVSDGETIEFFASSTARKYSGGNVFVFDDGIASRWAAQHLSNWKALDVTAFIYSADDEMQCLAVHTPHGSGRLNKQDCLGKSLRFLDPEIAAPRMAAIQQALSTQQTITYKYTHEWDDRHWEFTGEVIPLMGFGEVMVKIHDDHQWQTQYWIDKANQKNH